MEYDADCGGLDRGIARGVLTPGALTFLAELVHEFRDGVAEVSKRGMETRLMQLSRGVGVIRRACIIIWSDRRIF